MRNVFVEIIETVEEVTKEHNRNNHKKSWLDKASFTFLLIGCIMAFIGGVLLYLTYAFAPNEDSLTVVKGIILVIVLLGLISLLLSILAIILDLFIIIIKSKIAGSKISANSFINRAKVDYPLLRKQYRRLSCKFTQYELTSFAEWADNRIKTELKMTALVLAFIAASPKLKKLADALKAEFLSIWKTGKASTTNLNIDLFPISFESIAFIIVMFAIGIRLLSFKWGKTHFYAQYTANRMKEEAELNKVK